VAEQHCLKAATITSVTHCNWRPVAKR